MRACRNMHGMEGYTQLTGLLRPHKELRGFYFGLRAVIGRMCLPKGDEETGYTQLNEFKISRNETVLMVEFTPFRRLAVSKIGYKADLTSPLLAPLHTPMPNGDEELRGFFDKKCFCPMLTAFEDVISFVKTRDTLIEPIDVSCSNGYKGAIRCEVSGKNGIFDILYKFVYKEKAGNDRTSELIHFKLALQ